MAGTAKDPFLDTIANCTLCLDLDAEFLRRQWRRFGKLPPILTDYGFTLNKLAENSGAGLCQGCQLLSTAVELITKEVDLQFTNAQLEFDDEAHGIQGLCIRLTTLYPSYSSQDDWQRAQGRQDLKIDQLTGPNTRFPASTSGWRISSPLYEIFHDAESSDLFGTAICKRPQRVGSTGSDEAVAWAKLRLHECVSNHTLCDSKKGADGRLPVLPTRILDLGNADDGDTSRPSPLLVTTYGNMRGEYACLSHCWGPPEKKPLETRTETVGSFQTDGVPWFELPKTFQEVLVFTRKLGIRYLWIDSLCIIQNDANDWFREAGRMATIYDDATLTIAATSSSSSPEGLYRESVPSWPLGSGIHLRRCSDPIFFEQRHSRNPILSDRVAPLLKRAWVLQERLISRRVLHFTPLELVFECYTGNETESGFCWVNPSLQPLLRQLSESKSGEADSPTPDLEVSKNMWKWLIHDFTHLRLTRNEDNLPALAGLAKKIMALTGRSADDYMAGLWRQTFVDDMTWRMEGSVLDVGQINKNIPSWSWARDGMPKAFVGADCGESLAQLCDLVEGVCQADAVSGDSFLGVQLGSHVILSGYLLPARFTRLGIAIDANPRMLYNPSKDFNWFSDSSGRTPIVEGDRVFALPLVLRTSIYYGEAVDVPVLVLRFSSAEETYRRIGIFWSMIPHICWHYAYILEGNDFFADALERQITFVESFLNLAVTDPNALVDKQNAPGYMFMNALNRSLITMYGPKVTQLDGPIGAVQYRAHVEILKEALEKEKDRIREWTRRAEMGLEQVYSKTAIKLG